MKNITIRFADENDAKEILAIYTPYVKDTTITFECIVPTLEEFKARINKISSIYPYLVCLIDNKIIGYAYASRQRERDAYQWNAELSIYLDNKYLNLGIGTLLYKALLEILKLQNIYNVYGVITTPNPKSEKLHEKLGFTKLGVFHNTGYKFKAWHNVSWFEKALSEYIVPPAELTPINKVNKNQVDEIISKYINLLNK